ncbi:hypothetical protein OUZ56_001893 [Daphnia magna]|uniref:Uncharacterized protein n=1 Tax=Daphnia magna TaxID=35525 RepID=A0ABR0A418_9CRUS|nr:hypothetical protein OUZ56_001893 [Daphnia magna]
MRDKETADGSRSSACGGCNSTPKKSIAQAPTRLGLVGPRADFNRAQLASIGSTCKEPTHVTG